MMLGPRACLPVKRGNPEHLTLTSAKNQNWQKPGMKGGKKDQVTWRGELRIKGLEIRVNIEVNIAILFGLDVVSSAIELFDCTKESIMKYLSAIFLSVIASVWCEAAFLRSLVKASTQTRDWCLRRYEAYQE